MFLSAFQLVLGTLSLCSSFRALQSVLKQDHGASTQLISSGLLALAFFLSIPNVAPQLPLIATLSIAAA